MDEDLERQLRELEAESNALFQDFGGLSVEETTKPSSGLVAKPAANERIQARDSNPARTAEEEESHKNYLRLKAENQKKRTLERKIEPSTFNAEDAFKKIDESNDLFNQILVEEELEKVEREKLMSSRISQSLEDIMEHTKMLEELRKKEAEENEKQRKAAAYHLMVDFSAKLESQSREFVQALKLLLTAVAETNPGKYFQSTATICTAAHGFLEITDAMAEQSELEEAFRSDVGKLGEKIVTKIKEIIEAAKIAARDHPSPSGVDLLKSKALDLAKIVKTLVTISQPSSA